MPMSKKDFEAIAKVFAEIQKGNTLTTRERTLLGSVAVGIAEYSKHENSLFDRTLFLNKCGVLDQWGA